MPYVPSKKTDGKSVDRETLDKFIEPLAEKIASAIKGNLSLISIYRSSFIDITSVLGAAVRDRKSILPTSETGCNQETRLAMAIYEVGEKYGYEGAYLGELNYAITRLIQRVPQIKVAWGDWKDELRYWIEAVNFEACFFAASKTVDEGNGISGVFLDIALEHKREMNAPYEADQMLKSGHCFFGTHYNRLVELVDDQGRHVGYFEVMLKRSDATLRKDVLDGRLVLQAKPLRKP